ncbi:MAG: DUF1638 domain-containing protein [archaeon]|nr:DUF1638 domain-containing protein [archaeon]
MNKREVLEKIKTQIMSVKGVVGVAELNKEQCETVAHLEEIAMKNVFGGMGRGKNEGVKESLSREIIMVLFTDIHFDIPKDSTAMQLISEGEVVGMAVDLDKIEEFKKDKKYVVISDFFVIRRDAKISPAAFASGDTYFLFNGVQVDQFSKIPEIRDHVFSFPSPPVFDFTKEQFKDKMNLSDPQLAGFLIGFNLQENNRPYLISCGILKGEIEKLIEHGSLHVEPHFLDAGLHTDYYELEKELTRAIQESKDKSRGIIIVYGDLCHPNMEGIIGKYGKVVKVDALNCIDCLLGGHGRLLEIDPNHDCFYLSLGWMPSNLRLNARFSRLFGRSTEEVRKQFSRLKGIILLDSLGNLSEFKDEIEEFSYHTGLLVLDKKAIGLDGLKDVILEAIKKLKDVHK